MEAQDTGTTLGQLALLLLFSVIGYFLYLHFLLIGYFIYLFTLQMLSPFPVSPLETLFPIFPLPASMRVLPHPPTLSHLPALAFLYTGPSSLHRTKGLSSH
jgi:drug/metabolite transporter (DMT)-like permease